MVLFWKARVASSSTTSSRNSLSSANSRIPVIVDRKIPEPQSAPILTLPLELIQYIRAFLDEQTAASFCLSSRYIYYALGNYHLSTLLAIGRPKPTTRKNFEILERAFPSHWYCAWCDKFHAHDRDGGPKNFQGEVVRDCVEKNSFLHAGREYMLGYHHVRLAVNRDMWGEEYGIGVGDFAYHADRTTKIWNKKTPATLDVEAKIVSGHLMLHATFTTTVIKNGRKPLAISEGGQFEIPQLVFGHKDSVDGHSGLKKEIQRVLRCSSTEPSVTHLCLNCATDYKVTAIPLLFATIPTTTLTIEVWRDLGDGRNPFAASWRAHGEIGKGRLGTGGDVLRLTCFRDGQIRNAFEGEAEEPLKLEEEVKGKKSWCDVGRGKKWDDELKKNWTQEIFRMRDVRVMRGEMERIEGRNWYEDEMHRLELERLGKEMAGETRIVGDGRGFFGG